MILNSFFERQEFIFIFITQRLFRLIASILKYIIIIKSQKNVIFDLNNKIIQKFVKYCIYCQKHYYIKTKCDQLSNKNRQNNNNFNDDNDKRNNDNNNNNDGDDKFKNKKDNDRRNDKFNNKKRRRKDRNFIESFNNQKES